MTETKIINESMKERNRRKNILGLIIIVLIPLGVWIYNYSVVLKECKQNVQYVPRGASVDVWNSPAQEGYFIYYRTQSGFDVGSKFESREAAENDCVLYKRRN
ncbi:MAG: hypothetical protein KAS07_03180 [Candidatus Pacebacteria bacterium]|nr:hypothetical protein [Candidatus Paceibacterota bacterium]